MWHKCCCHIVVLTWFTQSATTKCAVVVWCCCVMQYTLSMGAERTDLQIHMNMLCLRRCMHDLGPVMTGAWDESALLENMKLTLWPSRCITHFGMLLGLNLGGMFSPPHWLSLKKNVRVWRHEGVILAQRLGNAKMKWLAKWKYAVLLWWSSVWLWTARLVLMFPL